MPPPTPDSVESILVWLAAVLTVALIHETGHALAAVVRSGRMVTPVRERTERLASLVARIEISGATAWNNQALAQLDVARTTARDALFVALGGPLASLFGGAALMLAAIPVPAGTGEDVLGTAGVTSVAFALIALIPLRREDKLLSTDGQQVLDAARALQRLRGAA